MEEELRSLSGSSEDEDGCPVQRNSTKYPVFNPNHDFEGLNLRVSLVFPTAKDLKQAVKENAIKEHREVKLVKNDKRRIKFGCASKTNPCEWFLYAGPMEDKTSFQIRKIGPDHTCPLSYNNKSVTAKWCAGKYVQKWKDQPDWNMSSFAREVREYANVDISKWTYYRARKFANKEIYGDNKMQYGMLWDYCTELRRSNPGSTVIMKTNTKGSTSPVFERIYICFQACKQGFRGGCRPIVGLDGCHLKANHKGQILSAMGIDANNGMFPIAFSVVESECKDSWLWFLDHLRTDLGIDSGNQVTWISDKQKGLESALVAQFTTPDHRHCLRHLYNNFKSQHRGVYLKQLMWNAASSTTEYRLVNLSY